MRILDEQGLCFDDVLLLPQHSDIKSRKLVDISSSMAGINLQIPILSANMATVTGLFMAAEMHRVGGAGVLHRFVDTTEVERWVQVLKYENRTAIPSIGVQSEDVTKAQIYADLGADMICVDVAHGDSLACLKMVEEVAKTGVRVMAGNVATYSGALALINAGAAAIKVGIGPGSVCTTRIVTGHGVPQLTAIMACAQVKQKFPDVGIVADGGIRNSGDMVKALAAGADAVMIGNLLAGAHETPGLVVDGYKYYRGMASRQQQLESKGAVSGTPEGEEIRVVAKGKVQDIINDLAAGIRSGCSYSGAHTLEELRENAEFMKVSSNCVRENGAHGRFR